ncbi:hypothetical protein ACJ41O_010924 [Fusarium nematophilum]
MSAFYKSPASPPPTGRPYDEERLGWPYKPPLIYPRKYLRCFKPRMQTVCLLIIDVIILVVIIRTIQPLITHLVRNKELFSPTLTLPVPKDSDKRRPAAPRKIPRILHQTVKNETIPEKWVESQQSCKEMYHDYEYKLWTDETAREFLSAEYPWFVDVWDNYVFPIQRADSIRYFILYHYGGIYLDMDIFCNRSIPMREFESNDLMPNAIFETTLPTGVTNDVMITTARHPAFAMVISKLPVFNAFTRPWAKLQPYASIMMASGPLFVSLVLTDYLIGTPDMPSTRGTVQTIERRQLVPYIKDLGT